MENVTPISAARPKVLEFFAGIGLARMGLEDAGFRVVWANDYEPDKKAMYDQQFGEAPDHAFALGDIGKVRVDDLPRDARLAWASSPCTDLSLAGTRAGLDGARRQRHDRFRGRRRSLAACGSGLLAPQALRSSVVPSIIEA